MSKHFTDNPTNAERLSALMDGELSSQELESLLSAIDEDPQLKQLWRNMHMAQGAMTQSSQAGLNLDISAAVMSAVKADPNTQVANSDAPVISFPSVSDQDSMHSGSGVGRSAHIEAREMEAHENVSKFEKRQARSGASVREPSNRYLQMAVAASLAIVTLFTWNNWGGDSRNDGMKGDANIIASRVNPLVDEGAEEFVVAPSRDAGLGQIAETSQSAILAQNTDLDSAPTYLRAASTQNEPLEAFKVERRKNTQRDYAQWQQLEPYVMAHTVRSVHPAGTGMISFGRVVDADTQPKPVVKVYKVSR